MKTFSQYIESKKSYNNSGVPWYSPSDTPAIRAKPNYGNDGTEAMAYAAYKNKYQNMLGRRFVIKEDGAFARRTLLGGEREHPPGSEGTIVNVGGSNITYVMDDRPNKKRTFCIRSFFNCVDLLPEK